MNKKVLVIAGATASGKSALAVKLAKDLNGEIISGDSIQVYRGLDIGSGKIKEEEMEGVRHHLIDIKDPGDTYSVYEFQKMGREALEDIDQRGSLPILCGGTGLYIKALIYDYEFKTEEGAYKTYDDIDDLSLHQMLEKIDPVSALNIHPNNRRRVLRALNYYEKNKMPLSFNKTQKAMYDALILALDMPRDQLYQRIDERIDQMIKAGLLKEVEELLKKGVSFDDQAMKGIGYREFKAYFDQEKTLDEVIAKIKSDSHNFAKRQYTWLRHQLKVEWIAYDESYEHILERVQGWLDGRSAA